MIYTFDKFLLFNSHLFSFIRENINPNDLLAAIQQSGHKIVKLSREEVVGKSILDVASKTGAFHSRSKLIQFYELSLVFVVIIVVVNVVNMNVNVNVNVNMNINMNVVICNSNS